MTRTKKGKRLEAAFKEGIEKAEEAFVPITEERWDHFSYYPPPWWYFYDLEDISEEDLCDPCKGFGEIDFGQFHPGSKCDHCQGSGLVDGYKKDILFKHRKLHSLIHRYLPAETLDQLIAILEEDEDE